MICYDLDNINYPVTIAFPTGLAKESKQDDQIVIADAIKTQTDKLTFDNGNLNVNASINADGLATEITLADTLIQSERIENLLVNLLKEAKETNRSLKKMLGY